MDADVRAFYLALAYNAAILLIALLAWYFIVRKLRKDGFKPNPRHKHVNDSDGISIDIESEKACCCGIFHYEHWLARLWRWDISRFGSTDCYLYLLFQRRTAQLFLAIAILALFVNLPIIYTAKDIDAVGGGEKLRQRGFFERCVITNVPSLDFNRLWVLYTLVWVVLVICLITNWSYYTAVRSDDFRPASLTSRKKRASESARFMPNRHSICVKGLDKSMLSSVPIRQALLHFFEAEEIVAVHLAMDYSEALAAHRSFQKSLGNLQAAQAKLQPEDGSSFDESSRPTRSRAPAPRKLPSEFASTPLKWNQPAYGDSTNADLAMSLLGSYEFSRRLSNDRDETQPANDIESSGSSRYRASSCSSSSAACLDESTPPNVLTRVDASARMPDSRLSSVWEEAGRESLPPKLLTKWKTQVHTPQSKPTQKCFRTRRACKDREADLKDKVAGWEEKVLLQYSILNRIRSRPPSRNVGMAFVSFEHASAVRFAMSYDFTDPACPMYRARDDGDTSCWRCGTCMTEAACNCDRWHRSWKIREAPPPQDIVWENTHISDTSRTLRRMSANLFIFLLSLLLTSSAMATDALVPFAQHVETMIQRASFLKLSVSGFVAPLILYVITALLLPFLVGWAADLSRFWRHSARDRAVLHGNVNFMVLNSLIFPVLGTTSIQTIVLFFFKTGVSDLPATIGALVAGASGSFLARYVLNTAFINSAMQLLQLPMLSQQRVMIKLGKRPKRWAFDFGYWYAFHLSILAVSIVFCIDFPLIPVLGCIFFTAKYWVDKYNLSFHVWKIAGESAGAVAASVISFIFYFQALFLFIMAGYFVTVGAHGGRLLDEAAKAQAIPAKRMLFISLPTQRQPRGLVIGGIFLLVASILIVLLTLAERAQRTIVHNHAGKLRSLARRITVSFARCMAAWGVVTRRRGVVVGEEERDSDLSEFYRERLKSAYEHPYAKTDKDGSS